MTAFQGNIILKEYIQCSRTLNYFSSVVAATVTAMSHNYRFSTKIWYFGMSYDHAKTSCPAQCKKNLVFVPYAADMFCHNTKRATNRWHLSWGKDMIQDTYDQTRKSFILEFLYTREYLALRTEQVLHHMRQWGNVT